MWSQPKSFLYGAILFVRIFFFCWTLKSFSSVAYSYFCLGLDWCGRAQSSQEVLLISSDFFFFSFALKILTRGMLRILHKKWVHKCFAAIGLKVCRNSPDWVTTCPLHKFGKKWVKKTHTMRWWDTLPCQWVEKAHWLCKENDNRGSWRREPCSRKGIW